MHETVVDSLPTGLADRTNARPDAGFAASPACRIQPLHARRLVLIASADASQSRSVLPFV